MEPGQDGITLFLCGDVMLGRGIDQIMHYPSDPTLYESYVTSALGYVELAERAHGPIPRDCPSTMFGVTRLATSTPRARGAHHQPRDEHHDKHAPGAEGHQLQDAPGQRSLPQGGHVDCCVLANNHVLDWGAKRVCLKPYRYCSGKVLPLPGRGPIARKPKNPSTIALPEGARRSRVRPWSQPRAAFRVMGGEARPARRKAASRSIARDRKPDCRAHSCYAEARRPRRRLHPLGLELGLPRPRGAARVRSCADRCRRLRSLPRSLVTPSATRSRSTRDG